MPSHAGIAVDGMILEAYPNAGSSNLEEAHIVRLTDTILTVLVACRGSNLFIERGKYKNHLRFRIDGVRCEVSVIPQEVLIYVKKRIQVMASLEAQEELRLPRAARMECVLLGNQIRLRIATLPTMWGEKLVLWVNEDGQSPIELHELNLENSDLETITRWLTDTYGIILVTGSRGSGRTTTLRAIANRATDAAKSVVILEPDFEDKVSKSTHLYLVYRTNLSVTTVLERVEAQSPDIVIIDSYWRPDEAVRIAATAKPNRLTFLTMTAGTPFAALNQLRDLGFDDQLVSNVVKGIICTRLVRKLCPNCKVTMDLRECPEEFEALRETCAEANYAMPEKLTCCFRVGCEYCLGTGFYGRTAFNDVLNLTSDILEDVLLGNARPEHPEQYLPYAAGSTLANGIRKISRGVTTASEVARALKRYN